MPIKEPTKTHVFRWRSPSEKHQLDLYLNSVNGRHTLYYNEKDPVDEACPGIVISANQEWIVTITDDEDRYKVYWHWGGRI